MGISDRTAISPPPQPNRLYPLATFTVFKPRQFGEKPVSGVFPGRSLSSSGSGSSPDVGQRTPTGYSEGGFTENRSNDYEPVGIVHANEWVASAAMVRAMPVTFARLEAVRRYGNYKSGITGFADGGFVSESKGPAPVQQTGLNLEGLNAAIDKFASTVERPIRAYTLLSDVNAAQELDSKLKKITSKS